jgi:hypothetical protein
MTSTRSPGDLEQVVAPPPPKELARSNPYSFSWWLLDRDEAYAS